VFTGVLVNVSVKPTVGVLVNTVVGTDVTTDAVEASGEPGEPKSVGIGGALILAELPTIGGAGITLDAGGFTAAAVGVGVVTVETA
jgi:hypothetical protein